MHSKIFRNTSSYYHLRYREQATEMARQKQSRQVKLPLDPFRNISVEEASGQRLTGTALTARQNASTIHFQKLSLTADQAIAVEELYKSKDDITMLYRTDNANDQLQANAFMAHHRLDLDERESFDNRWNVRWSKKTGAQKTCRVLYQW